MRYAVYIMAGKPYGTLYIGVTNDVSRRVYEHKFEPAGFVKKYKIHTLVYIEYCDNIESAIHYEKQSKKWRREWKIKLIKRQNPHWSDISYTILRS